MSSTRRTETVRSTGAVGTIVSLRQSMVTVPFEFTRRRLWPMAVTPVPLPSRASTALRRASSMARVIFSIAADSQAGICPGGYSSRITGPE